MNNQIKRICILFSFLFLTASLSAQIKSLGFPIIRNYSPVEYNGESQNWASISDNRGIMFFANNKGLLEFDGIHWNMMELPNKSAVRCFAKDKDGRIFVGSQDDFGILKTDSLGKIYFESQLELIPAEHRRFKDVWKMVFVGDELFILTFSKIFIISNGRTRVFESEKGFHQIFYVNGKIYVREWEKGLQIYEKKHFVKLPDGEKLANERVYAMFPIDKDHVLLVTRNLGILHYDGIELTNWKTDADELIKKGQIYTGTTLNDKYFILGTLNEGVIIIDKNGKTVKLINKKTGLQDNIVFYTYLDQQNNLWLSLSSGISFVEIASPYSAFNELNGIETKVFTSTIYNNKLYICGEPHAAFCEWNSLYNPFVTPLFQQIEKSKGQDWQFFQSKGDLLIAHNPGLLTINQNQITEVPPTNLNIWKMDSLRDGSGRILCSSLNGFMLLQKNGIAWTFVKIIKGFTESTRYSEISSNNEIWTSIGNRGIYHLKIDFEKDSIQIIKHYDSKDGLPTNLNNMAKIFDNEIIAATEKGFYKLHKETNKFVPYDAFNKLLPKLDVVSFIPSNSKDGIWIDCNGIIGKIIKGANLEYQLYYKPILKFGKTGSFHHVNEIDSSNILFGIDKSIIHFNPNQKGNYETSFNCIIRKVQSVLTDTVFFGGCFPLSSDTFSLVQQKKQIRTLLYKDNSLRFVFSSNFYENPEKTEYSYKLEGFDKDWSNWNTETKKEYTNLPEGKYKFRVKARNIYQHESQESIYAFSIKAPWYKTFWAYLGYFIILSLVITLIIRIYTRRLKQANIKLEKLVQERTAEITKQNEEIFQQNLQIKSSIRYALTIQRAMLPLKDELDKFFENFIIYRPKDIVSGDFYWFQEVENENQEKSFFVAAVDCTGHGVPGAFMSMMGYRLINEIINEKRISHPEEVLELINTGIGKALHQQKSDNKDGMDICLCRIDNYETEPVIHFAGAKLPIFIYSKEEQKIHRIKGSNKRIGGIRKRIIESYFEGREIIIKKGDVIYLSTDGYIDQSNEKRERFGTRRFVNVLGEITAISMIEQKEKLEIALDAFQNQTHQRDDITVIGIKL